MAEGRIEQEWNHTAAVLTVLVNVNRDPKRGRPAKPADFHPMARRRNQSDRPIQADMQTLRRVFFGN